MNILDENLLNLSKPSLQKIEIDDTPRTQETIINDVRISTALGRAANTGDWLSLGELDVQARDYQHEVWDVIQSARDSGKDSGLIHLATGLGKTTVAVADALRFADEFVKNEGRAPKILFAVHQTEILDQAADRFTSVEPNLTQGRYDGHTKNLSSTVTFATFQSLYKNIDSFDPQQFDYIIYDEVHHAQADTYKSVVEHFKPIFKLGLTATPNRMDEKDIRDLFGEELYSKPLAEAMTEGYLADVDYHIVFDDAVKKAMESGFDPMTVKEIRDLLENESRNEEIAQQIREKMEEIGLEKAKTIIFCQNIQQADEMASLLNGKSYHSSLDSDARIKTLEEFKNNGLQIITTRDMFNEGVDIPDARLIIFLRSTSSKTVFEQQLGRGLRKTISKETVSVLDFVANIERLMYVKELVDVISKSDTGDIASGEITMSPDDAKSKFQVTGNHTEFDFDKISIDLMDKLASINQKLEMADLAELWKKNFGDEEPTLNKIIEASESGLFVKASLVNDRGGIKELKRLLGFEYREYPDSIDGIVEMWKENFGAMKPTRRGINEASKARLFCPITHLNKYGGLRVLQEKLGFETVEFPDNVDDLASLWIERFGDRKPVRKNINEASKERLFLSSTGLNTYCTLAEFQQKVAEFRERSS